MTTAGSLRLVNLPKCCSQWCICVYSDDEGRELCRKRGSEFKLPYPIIDINGCDSPQTSLSVSSSTGDLKPPLLPLVRPVAGRKSSAPRNSRKRKKDSSLLGVYSTSNDLKNCSELVQRYQAVGIGEAYLGNTYHDMVMGCNEYSRIQPMIAGCRAEYDDEDMTKMRHDVSDCQCYYGNSITSSAPAAGAGAWYWGPENTQLASYLYDQQRYLADYSMYGRLVTSPPPSLSNGYEALPVTTIGALYEALTPPDDDDGCLLSTTTTTFPQRPHRADDNGNGDDMISSSCIRNDNADRFVASSNDNNTSAAGLTGVGHGAYGVATPVIQMSAKSRYIRYIPNYVLLNVLISLN